MPENVNYAVRNKGAFWLFLKLENKKLFYQRYLAWFWTYKNDRGVFFEKTSDQVNIFWVVLRWVYGSVSKKNPRDTIAQKYPKGYEYLDTIAQKYLNVNFFLSEFFSEI